MLKMFQRNIKTQKDFPFCVSLGKYIAHLQLQHEAQFSVQMLLRNRNVSCSLTPDLWFLCFSSFLGLYLPSVNACGNAGCLTLSFCGVLQFLTSFNQLTCLWVWIFGTSTSHDNPFWCNFFYLSWLVLINWYKTMWPGACHSPTLLLLRRSLSAQPFSEAGAAMPYGMRPSWNCLMFFMLHKSICILLKIKSHGFYALEIIFYLTFIGPCLIVIVEE